MHEGVTLTCFKAKVNLRAHDILVEIYISLFIKEEGRSNSLHGFVLKDPKHKQSYTIILVLCVEPYSLQ